jgi:beta-galactosidase
VLQPVRLRTLDATRPNTAITTGHLRLGGADPLGNRLEVTSRYLAWNGRPLVIISGEFHYSRYPDAYWEDELLKLKAGGINTVATYVFWIFHEERQGVFEWQGQKNLRGFVALCARHGLKVILRIGPFAHGEWRNGGLPDWLYGQPFEVRSNDPAYLRCAERLYAEIGQQVHGLLFADGGPIIGIQLENEYMHAGAPWEVLDEARNTEWVTAGRDGVAHLKALKALAHQAGLNVPLYLVTAWGAPFIPLETLPVYGGYAYPVWVDNPQPSDLFSFQDGGAEGEKDPDYPLLYAEMQGGIQVRYHNRPVVPARSVEAMALVCIGRGSNWLGYYMYHGGTTPLGAHGFSHERLHPQLSYDFQAPLGEFGEYHASYHALRLLHLFLQAYAEVLAPMGTLLPGDAGQIQAEDTASVRWCVRSHDGAGFLFANNFQDHVETHDLPDVAFEINTPGGQVRIPQQGSLTVAAEACFILPFNQLLGGARLLSATVQPLTVLHHDGGSHYFYFALDGLEPEYCFAPETVRRVDGALEQQASAGHLRVAPPIGTERALEIETASGQRLRITTLTRAEAEGIYQGTAWGSERVIGSLAEVVFREDQVETRSAGLPEWTMTIWPPLRADIRSDCADCEQTNLPDQTRLHIARPAQALGLSVQPAGPRKTLVRLAGPLPADVSEAFLRVDYDGDTGMAFIDGRLVADHFNNGTAWTIGLKRFERELLAGELCLVFSPWRQGVVKNTSSQLAGRFEFEGDERLIVRDIAVTLEYRTCLKAASA